MHTHKRIPVVLCLLLMILPLAATLPVLAAVERDEAQEALERMIGRAAASYAAGRGLPALAEAYEKQMYDAEKALPALARKKREVRLELAASRMKLKVLHEKYGIDTTQTGGILSAAEEKGFIGSFLEDFTDKLSPFPQQHIGRRILTASFGDITTDEMETEASMKVFVVFVTAKKTVEEEADLRKKHEEALTEYNLAHEEYAQAKERLTLTQKRVAAVRSTVADVHEQVLKLQGELARIDARLRTKAERALIEKGLIGPKDSQHAAATEFTQTFGWPVHGKLSSGFFNEQYEKFFGVPHRGQDIAVPQSSPVFSAAEGIVFLVRDGGETGYSYVLIGHRNGYATLYGHLLQIFVSAGQEVALGEQIGLSGGEPGSYGAGPMTTGPHLHFEVIKGGTHVDPLTVLP